ncbi:MAG: DUF5360 family protein [Chloroflexota bacterium]
MQTKQHYLLTLTEVGMLLYWIFATFVVLEWIQIDPALMYSDYKNPIIVAWNWSFFPLDVLFAILGLIGRFAPLRPARKELLTTISLVLMFCAGLMAISFWLIRGSFDPFWWGTNLWLIALSTSVLVQKFANS